MNAILSILAAIVVVFAILFIIFLAHSSRQRATRLAVQVRSQERFIRQLSEQANRLYLLLEYRAGMLFHFEILTTEDIARTTMRSMIGALEAGGEAMDPGFGPWHIQLKEAMKDPSGSSYQVIRTVDEAFSSNRSKEEMTALREEWVKKSRNFIGRLRYLLDGKESESYHQST